MVTELGVELGLNLEVDLGCAVLGARALEGLFRVSELFGLYVGCVASANKEIVREKLHRASQDEHEKEKENG